MKKICANLKKYAIDIIKRALADEEIESYSNQTFARFAKRSSMILVIVII